MNHAPINDLRSALAFLASLPGELIETNVEVDPEAELCGVYRLLVQVVLSAPHQRRSCYDL